MRLPRLTIITPLYNEEGSLPEYRARMTETLERLPLEYEFVLVDDHSTDASPRLARQWAAEDPRVHYLRLSRNFGPHTAVAAGLARATGDCAIVLAADLQDPPEVIGELLDRWADGYDIVWGRRDRGDGQTRANRFTSALYYWMIRVLALPAAPPTGAHFALLDRKVVDVLKHHPEKNTSLFALIVWMGFRQTSIVTAGRPRHAGRTKWNLARKLKLAVDSLVSFSYLPIRLASLVGVLVSLLGLVYAVAILINWFLLRPVAGWSALMVAVLILGGFQSLMLGILGEYIWRSFDESRGRPPYVVEEEIDPAQPNLASDPRHQWRQAGATNDPAQRPRTPEKMA
jgi:dolichol-phosphate mannosyltransferase